MEQNSVTISLAKIREWRKELDPYYFSYDRNNDGVQNVCDDLDEIIKRLSDSATGDEDAGNNKGTR